jgi:uncharacterized protein (DUF1330 family)
MSVYLIGQINVHDRSEYKNYVKGFLAMFGGYKGEVIVADEAVQVMEGEWPWARTVIIRFDDEAEAMRWYNSPEYKAAAKFRFNSATTNLVLTKGLR